MNYKVQKLSFDRMHIPKEIPVISPSLTLLCCFPGLIFGWAYYWKEFRIFEIAFYYFVEFFKLVLFFNEFWEHSCIY